MSTAADKARENGAMIKGVAIWLGLAAIYFGARFAGELLPDGSKPQVVAHITEFIAEPIFLLYSIFGVIAFLFAEAVKAAQQT